MQIERIAILYFSIILIIPIGIYIYLGIERKKEVFIAFLRMILQLSFVGIYLKYVFQIDSYIVNVLWIFVMLLTASLSIKNQSKIKIKYFFISIFISLSTTIFLINLFLLLLFPYNILMSARYLIPITGMILGNSLRGHIIGVSSFHKSLTENEDNYIHNILLGATYSEALKPYFKDAFKLALAPQIASIATIGLVSLPGMMTGQILGGSTPNNAVSYQMIIMIAIFSAVSISSFFTLFILTKISINKQGIIRS